MNILDRHNKWIGRDFCYACRRAKQRYIRDPQYYVLEQDRTGTTKFHWLSVPRFQQMKEYNQMVTAATTPKVGDWVWHIHHAVLVERLEQPLADRVSYIKNSKTGEVETRLHFMRPVKNPPKGNVNAEAIAEAQALYDSIEKAYQKFGVEKDILDAAEVILANAKKSSTGPATQADWEALHKRECYFYCPWNGKTLFPLHAQGIA